MTRRRGGKLFSTPGGLRHESRTANPKRSEYQGSGRSPNGSEHVSESARWYADGQSDVVFARRQILNQGSRADVERRNVTNEILLQFLPDRRWPVPRRVPGRVVDGEEKRSRQAFLIGDACAPRHV